MGTLSMDELRDLTSQQNDWCVSIYMPTIMKSHEVRQNPIRYKNLLDQARNDLKTAGLEKGQIDEIFEPAEDLLKEGLFWQHQDQGLAIFLTAGFFQFFHLPFEVEEQVLIDKRFYFKPLLPLLGSDEEFYILALSQNQLRLLRATQHEVEAVDVPNMPENMQDALGYDEIKSDMLQWHTGTGQNSKSGDRRAMFHGHGEGKDSQKDFLLNYMRSVDKAVSGYLKDSDAPLILACVEYLQPIYKEANTYLHLSEELIPGNPEEIQETELRDEAWKRIQPVYQTNKENRVEQYKILSGRKDPLAVKDVAEIVKYAPYGRIDVLFLDKNAKSWGTFDETSNKVKFENEQRPGNQDLLDFAAVQTLLNGGEVIPVETEQLPEEGSPALAIFRY